MITEIFDENFSLENDWSKSMRSEMQHLFHQMREEYQIFNEKCDFWDGTERYLNERFDETNHCRATHQLIRNIVSWGSSFLKPCDGENSILFDEIASDWRKIKEKLEEKFGKELCSQKPIRTTQIYGGFGAVFTQKTTTSTTTTTTSTNEKPITNYYDNYQSELYSKETHSSENAYDAHNNLRKLEKKEREKIIINRS